MSDTPPAGAREWGDFLEARHRLILAWRAGGKTCGSIAATLSMDETQVWLISQAPPVDRMGVAPTQDIAEAAGVIDWHAAMPGRWAVEARATHVIVRTPGGTGILTAYEAMQLEQAVAHAKQLVHQAVVAAEARKAGTVAGPPGASGG